MFNNNQQNFNVDNTKYNALIKYLKYNSLSQEIYIVNIIYQRHLTLR